MAFDVQAGTLYATSGSTSSTATPGLPASVIVGDLLLLFLEETSDIAVSSISTDPGWTQIYADTGSADRFRLYQKTAGASEAAPVVTYAGALSNLALLVRVRGWDSSGAGAAQITAAASASATPSIDPPTAGSIKIGAVHIDPTTAGTASWSGVTATLGGGGDSNFSYLSVAYKLEDTAGALSFSYSGTPNTPTAVIMSVAPGAAPAGPSFVPQITIS